MGKRPDKDNPEWTAQDFARARSFEDVFPHLAGNARRGRPPCERPKQQVTLRLDQDVLARFKEGGPGWQTRMNAALRAAAGLTDTNN